MALCRICYQHKPTFFFFENQAKYMLESLTAVKIAYSDKIPSDICFECYTELKAAFNVYEKFRQIELKYQDDLFTDFLTENYTDLLQVVRQEGRIVPMERKFDENAPGPSTAPDSPPICQDPCKKYSCQVCCTKFDFSPDCIDHMRQHLLNLKPKNDILCEICGAIFVCTTAYDIHMEAFHTPKFDCVYCSESFSTPANLEQHIKQIHQNENPDVSEALGV